MGILANQPFYHFWQTIVFVIFAGGPVLILLPGPGLALNGPVHLSQVKFILPESLPERYNRESSLFAKVQKKCKQLYIFSGPLQIMNFLCCIDTHYS